MAGHMYVVKTGDAFNAKVSYTKCLHYVWRALTEHGKISKRVADAVVFKVPPMRIGETMYGKDHGRPYAITVSDDIHYSEVDYGY